MKTKKVKKFSNIKLFNISKLRWSVEIEVEFPQSKDSQKLIERHRVLTGWKLDFDGSLENGAEYKPTNKNKMYYNEESLTQLKEVLALIKVHRGKVTQRCGLHIHVDCRNFTDKQVLEIIREFVHKQRYVVKRFAVDKSRLEATCKLLPRENLHKITEKQIHKYRNNTDEWAFNEYSYFDEKYYSLNSGHLRKGDYGTLEFRLFDGTLSYRKLKEQIYWVICFIRDCLERE